MSEKRTIAVDFDGVIAEYDGWNDGIPGRPRQDVLSALATLRSEGWKIIVHSCRPTATLIGYLTDNGVPFDEVNPGSPYSDNRGKPSATVYWDDRAYKYSGDAKADIEAIRDFRTWSGRS
jgi:adenylylsulfate kinase